MQFLGKYGKIVCWRPRRSLIRVALVVVFSFLPKFLGGGADESSFCSKMNAAIVVWTIIGGGDTQTLLAGKKC